MSQAPPPSPPPSSAYPSRPPPTGRPASGTVAGRGRRGLWVVIGIVALVALIALVIWAVTSLTRTTTMQEQAFAPEGVDALEVVGLSGSITVVVVDRADISVTTRLTSSVWQQPSTSRDIDEGTLSITSDCGRRAIFSVCSVEHQIAVPPDALATMRLRATAGAVRVDGYAGDLEVDTTAGSIVLSDHAGEVARLRTTAGEINVESVTPPRRLEAVTTAGSIDVLVPDEAYAVSADTTVGDVDVDVRRDPGADRFISVSTTAGSVSVAPR